MKKTNIDKTAKNRKRDTDKIASISVENEKTVQRIKINEEPITEQNETSTTNTYDRFAGFYNLKNLFFYALLLKVIISDISSTRFTFVNPFPLQCFWFSIVFFFNILRCNLNYLLCQLSKSLYIRFLYIFISEAILGALVFYKIRGFCTSLGCYMMGLFSVFKLISFAIKSAESDKNINFRKYFLFLGYPILVYRENYKIKEKSSLYKALKCLFKSLFLCLLIYQLFCSFAIPKLDRILNSDNVTERLSIFANLSFYTAVCFILFFKLVFQEFFGILREINGFNEDAYGDWWNSSTCEEFWRKWNICTNEFIKIHVFEVLKEKGLPGVINGSVCFFFSGVFHEYLVSMSLKKLNGAFFIAMMLQIPFHFITRKFAKAFPNYSNYFFWLVFTILGQPGLVLSIYLIYRS